MEETIPDGIVSPSGGQEYAYAAQLGALAESVQATLLKRANCRRGTQTDRLNQTATLPDGTLWKDTTGDRALWLLDSGQWKQIWPEPLSRSVYGGSTTTKLGIPFLNLRWLTDENQVYHVTLRPGTDPESIAATLLGMTGNNVDTALNMYRNGQLGVQSGNVNRFLPFANAAGSFVATVTGPDNINTIDVSFPTSMFTMRPVVSITLGTDRPDIYSHSITDVTTSGFKLHVHRTLSGSFGIAIDWTAFQRTAVA